MRMAANIAGVLLGALFLFASLAFLLHLGPTPPPPPEGSPTAMFMGATFGTGFLHFVKILELVGGLLVLLPATRVVGLLILTPIVVNIVAFHVLIAGGGLIGLPLVAVALTLFLIWVHRRGLAALAADRG